MEVGFPQQIHLRTWFKIGFVSKQKIIYLSIESVHSFCKDNHIFLPNVLVGYYYYPLLIAYFKVLKSIENSSIQQKSLI